MIIQHKAIVGVVACAMLCSVNGAFGFVPAPLEDDAPAIWDMPELGLGSGMDDLHAPDLRNRRDETASSISMDFFSERETLAVSVVYGADLKLHLEKDTPWTLLDVTTGDKIIGSASTSSWDATSWIDGVLDVGLTDSNLSSAWGVGRLPVDGMDTSLNSGYLGNIVTIPEPATYGLITIFGGGLLLFRRRFRS